MQVMVILAFILPTQTWVAVKVIADVGQPAADFPPEYIYWIIAPNPVIGASGHNEGSESVYQKSVVDRGP